MLCMLDFLHPNRSFLDARTAKESIQDHGGAVGNGMAVNNHQNFQVQPTEVLLR